MEKKETSVKGYAAAESAMSTQDNMQWTKYQNVKGGHGIAAEDGNALIERICGRKVKAVGADNAKNGADLLIDGVGVQLKYHKDAYSTLEACFGADGMFRYNGKQVMVPADQYEEVVRRMRQKIAEGKVAGVLDPDEALKIIRKGRLTRSQAGRLNKVGTKESLAFDMLSQAKVAGIMGGISALSTFYHEKKKGSSTKQSLVEASKEFGKTGGRTLAGGVLTQQLLRTKVGCSIASKAMRGNLLTGAVMFAVDSIPDTYHLCRGKMNVKEFGKKRTIGLGSMAGGSAGYVAGMAVGTAILPGIGTTIGGLIGGIGGGFVASSGIEHIFAQLG